MEKVRDPWPDEVWGFMEEGKFVKLPKIPMLLADLGPVPFEVTGAFGKRTIVSAPVEEKTDANDAQQPD